MDFAVGLGAGERVQTAERHCRRLTAPRASIAEAALDGSCAAQPQYPDSLQHIISMPLGELSEGLETPVQLIYLVTLLGFLVVGAYLVVRQVSHYESGDATCISSGYKPLLYCLPGNILLEFHASQSMAGIANDSDLQQHGMACRCL